ncbi:hypothetical protein V8B55DRAFT_1500865, partial [Mucor lusitanicus]
MVKKFGRDNYDYHPHLQHLYTFVTGLSTHFYEEYLAYGAADSVLSRESLDYYFNGRVHNVSESGDTLVKDCIVTDDRLVLKFPRSVDTMDPLCTVDAIITGPRQGLDFFPDVALHQVLLCPDPYKTLLTSAQWGNHDFGRLVVNRNRLPSLPLSIVQCSRRIETRIFFPRLYLAQNNQNAGLKSAKYGRLSEADRKIFVDEVFLPGFKDATHDAKQLRLAKDYDQAKSRGYSVTYSLDFVNNRDLDATLRRMRELLYSSPELSRFKDFYVVSASFGGKQDYDLFLKSVHRSDYKRSFPTLLMLHKLIPL